MEDNLVNDLKNALNEIPTQPGVESVTWATLVTPAVASLERTAENNNDAMFDWEQEEEKRKLSPK